MPFARGRMLCAGCGDTASQAAARPHRPSPPPRRCRGQMERKKQTARSQSPNRAPRGRPRPAVRPRGSPDDHRAERHMARHGASAVATATAAASHARERRRHQQRVRHHPRRRHGVARRDAADVSRPDRGGRIRTRTAVAGSRRTRRASGARCAPRGRTPAGSRRPAADSSCRCRSRIRALRRTGRR